MSEKPIKIKIVYVNVLKLKKNYNFMMVQIIKQQGN